jgi:hypothetical protein
VRGTIQWCYFLIVSRNVPRLRKVYIAVDAKLLFLLDFFELSTVALGASSPRATGTARDVIYATLRLCSAIELVIGEVSPVGFFLPGVPVQVHPLLCQSTARTRKRAGSPANKHGLRDCSGMLRCD